jgi:serine/threonine protein kinase
MAEELPDSPDLSNQRVAGYRIIHRLGRGGMADVYLAFQENLHRHVALKVLRRDFVDSADHQQRFLQEARHAAALVHPNIVQVFDIGQANGIHYIAQEYIPGNTLGAFIEKQKCLGLRESLSILIQAASALHRAAQEGIVHRDIKPENILLTSEGVTKVADFGLARARSNENHLTAVGVAMGTPLYMSPEQIQGTAVDQRSDLYSLGVTAYHMLSGSPPFSGETALALAMQHLQNPPPPLRQKRAGLPEALYELIDRLLAKQPSDRPADAASVLRSLRDIASKLEGNWHGDSLIPLTELEVQGSVERSAPAVLLQTTLAQQKIALRNRRWRTLGIAMGSILLATGLFTVFSLKSSQGLVPEPGWKLEQVERKPTVREQFFHAMVQGSVAQWKAVETYFPPEQSDAFLGYNLKAWLQLARVAIAQKDLELAQQTLDKILIREEVDPRILVLALLEKMQVDLELSQMDQLARDRSEARRYFLSLDTQQQQWITQQIPPHLLSYWEDRNNTSG